jgi:hypothetical protein
MRLHWPPRALGLGRRTDTRGRLKGLRHDEGAPGSHSSGLQGRSTSPLRLRPAGAAGTEMTPSAPRIAISSHDGQGSPGFCSRHERGTECPDGSSAIGALGSPRGDGPVPGRVRCALSTGVSRRRDPGEERFLPPGPASANTRGVGAPGPATCRVHLLRLASGRTRPPHRRTGRRSASPPHPAGSVAQDERDALVLVQ